MMKGTTVLEALTVLTQTLTLLQEVLVWRVVIVLKALV